MLSPEVCCVLILFITMTIAFAVGSLLVRLLFYSRACGADDISIYVMDGLNEDSGGSSQVGWHSAKQYAGGELRSE